MIRNDLKQLFLQENEFSKQRQKRETLNEYRRLYQRPENAREWDLNDPNRWKYLTPARISDDDSRLGPSSCQIFAGEDLQASARRKAQQEQLKNYFDIQVRVYLNIDLRYGRFKIKEKTKNDEQERMAKLLYDYKQLELTERGQTFERMEEECHRAMEIATQHFNEILVGLCYSIGLIFICRLFFDRLMKQRFEQMNGKLEKLKNNYLN